MNSLPLWKLCLNDSHFQSALVLLYLNSASLQDGDLLHAHVNVHSLNVGDGRVVVAVLVVGVDLKVRDGRVVARLRHHVAAVAHEVVLALIKGAVVRIPRRNTRGRVWRIRVEIDIVFSPERSNMFYNEVTTDHHSNPTSRQRGYL